MAIPLSRATRVLLVVTACLFAADLLVVGLVGTGAIDPDRFTVAERERPVVVVSTTFLDDLVLQVAGDKVRRELIVDPGGDPHLYEPTPRDQVAIERANLIVLNGWGLEPKIEDMVHASVRPDQKVVEAAAGLTPHYEDAANTVPDPHMWLNVTRAMRYVENIRDALVEVDPQNALLYRANAAAALEEMRVLDSHIRAIIETIPPESRVLVTTHDAFRYFGMAYGVTVIDTLYGVSTDATPGSGDVAALVENLRQYNVPAVFVESSVNQQLLRQAAADAGVRIGGTLYSDSLGFPQSGAHTYFTMMLTNARTLAEGLGGRATP